MVKLLFVNLSLLISATVSFLVKLKLAHDTGTDLVMQSNTKICQCIKGQIVDVVFIYIHSTFLLKINEELMLYLEVAYF